MPTSMPAVGERGGRVTGAVLPFHRKIYSSVSVRLTEGSAWDSAVVMPHLYGDLTVP